MSSDQVRRGIPNCLPHLRALAFMLARDRANAEDLVQDTVVRALRHADQFRPGTSLKAWTRTILRHTFLNNRRRQDRETRLDPQVPWNRSVTMGGQEQRLEVRDFNSALRQLPRSQRAALLLVGAQGHSYETAAGVEKCAVGTMKSRVARARAELRHAMAGRIVPHGRQNGAAAPPARNQETIMPTEAARKPEKLPPQHQDRQPGRETRLRPKPISDDGRDAATGRLRGRVALITGGDSGIGRAVAVAFAKEGADVAIAYLEEDEDAQETGRLVEALGRRFLALRGDLGDRAFCHSIVEEVVSRLGRLDVLVNNAGEQHPQEDLTEISPAQLEQTFRTNVFSMFYLTQAALPRMESGAAIINSASVTAYRGNPQLIDYAATKGAIVAFTRSLAASLASRGIRVNAVAPGPIWTPLIPASFDPEHVAKFGTNVPLGRVGQPAEVAPSYVFLASEDASYMTGQVLHPNGGEPVNG